MHARNSFSRAMATNFRAARPPFGRCCMALDYTMARSIFLCGTFVLEPNEDSLSEVVVSEARTIDQEMTCRRIGFGRKAGDLLTTRVSLWYLLRRCHGGEVGQP